MSGPRRRTIVACISLCALAVSSHGSAALQRHRTARPDQSAQGEAKDDNADQPEAADRKVAAAAQNGDRLFEQHKWADARAAYDRVLLETGNWSLPAARRTFERDVQCLLKLGEVDAALRQVAVLWGKRSPPDVNQLRYAARDKSSMEEWRTELANPEFTYGILEQIAHAMPNTADPEVRRRLALSRVKLDLEFARLLDPDSVPGQTQYGWDSGYADAGWWWRNRPVQKTRDDDEEDEDNQRSSVPRNAAGQPAFLKPPPGYQLQLGRSSKILSLERGRTPRSDARSRPCGTGAASPGRSFPPALRPGERPALET
jgi:hypothetical protein